MHGPICTIQKAVWINWLIYFIYDLGHWPCLWPWPWMSKVKSWKWHICDISDLIAKEWNKRRWIIWMVWYLVKNIWPTFYFHRMLQCRSGVTFLSLGTSSLAFPCGNGDAAYLGIKTSWGAVLGFTPCTHLSCMNFANFQVTRTQIWYKSWSNLLQLFNNIWNTDRLMEGWTDGDYTIWPWAKMEHWRRIQYCIASAWSNEYHWK